MRNRKKISHVEQIKKNPDMRLVFKSADYKNFVALHALADSYDVNVSVFSRHILINFLKNVKRCKNKDIQDVFILPVLQSMHGIEQANIFHDFELDYIEKPLELKTEKKKGSKNVKA